MRKDWDNATERLITISGPVRGVCNLLGLAMLVYALANDDIPVAMIAVAVLGGMVPSSGKVLQVSFGGEVRKVMHAFSITLFMGAIIMLVFS